MKALNKIAGGVDVGRVPNNASKLRVEEPIAAIRQDAESSGWIGEGDENVFEQAVIAYNEPWNAQGSVGSGLGTKVGLKF